MNTGKHEIVITRGEKIRLRRWKIDPKDPRHTIAGPVGTTLMREEFAWHGPALDELIAELSLWRDELRGKGPKLSGSS